MLEYIEVWYTQFWFLGLIRQRSKGLKYCFLYLMSNTRHSKTVFKICQSWRIASKCWIGIVGYLRNLIICEYFKVKLWSCIEKKVLWSILLEVCILCFSFVFLLCLFTKWSCCSCNLFLSDRAICYSKRTVTSSMLLPNPEVAAR